MRMNGTSLADVKLLLLSHNLGTARTATKAKTVTTARTAKTARIVRKALTPQLERQNMNLRTSEFAVSEKS